jgi:hypothetical protein
VWGVSGTDGEQREETGGRFGSGADIDTPNPARMYDYYLGGAANFAVDRAAAERVKQIEPTVAVHARANRAFLRRVVRRLAGEGMRQFLDLGSGVPTVGHVHEIAHSVDPTARIVYVDNEPVAASYSRSLLRGVPNTAVVREDLRDSVAVLDHPDTRRLLDLDQPVAVMIMAVMHFIMSDEDVAGLVAAYRDRTVPGSYLGVSHVSAPEGEVSDRITAQYQRTSLPFRSRTRAELGALFEGYEMVPPGLVYVSDWHPDPGPDPHRLEPQVFLGGVGRRLA